MPRLADRVTVISQKLLELARAAGRDDRDPPSAPQRRRAWRDHPRDALACRAALGLAPEGALLGYIANYHPIRTAPAGAWHAARAAVPDLKLVKTGPPFAKSLIAELGLAKR